MMIKWIKKLFINFSQDKWDKDYEEWCDQQIKKEQEMTCELRVGDKVKINEEYLSEMQSALRYLGLPQFSKSSDGIIKSIVIDTLIVGQKDGSHWIAYKDHVVKVKDDEKLESKVKFMIEEKSSSINNELKVGDRVVVKDGWEEFKGTIMEINHDGKFPIIIKYDNGWEVRCKSNGGYHFIKKLRKIPIKVGDRVRFCDGSIAKISLYWEKEKIYFVHFDNCIASFECRREEFIRLKSKK